MSPPPPPRWSLLREPLVHFALGALALLGAERVAARRRVPERPPLAVPAGVSRDVYVREEALVREALARGLGEGDAVIRQRLVQKMAFLLEAEATPEEPDDATLQRWLDAHPDDYRRVARVSFDQVFFSRERRGVAGEADARAALGQLAPDEPVASAQFRGDPSPAGPSLPGRSFADVTRAFGYAFAAALDGVAVGAWRGPIVSTQGWHLVRIIGRDGGGVTGLAAVRADVRRRWMDERRAALVHIAEQGLARRHGVAP
jgi:hypothetical protein